MTARTLIKTADAKRLAQIAKSEGIAVVVEVDGKKVSFIPETPAIHSQQAVDEKEVIEL